MQTTISYDLPDYMAMARQITDSYYDTTGRQIEAEYKAGGYTLILTIEHEVEYRTERGGSFEGYDFEPLSVVDHEEWSVIDFGCYNEDGEEVSCDFRAKDLLNILN